MKIYKNNSSSGWKSYTSNSWNFYDEWTYIGWNLEFEADDYYYDYWFYKDGETDGIGSMNDSTQRPFHDITGNNHPIGKSPTNSEWYRGLLMTFEVINQATDVLWLSYRM